MTTQKTQTKAKPANPLEVAGWFYDKSVTEYNMAENGHYPTKEQKAKAVKRARKGVDAATAFLVQTWNQTYRSGSKQ